MVPLVLACEAASSNYFFLPGCTHFYMVLLHFTDCFFLLAEHSFSGAGASTAIRSKNCTKTFARLPASSFVTTQFPTPIRSMFWESIFALPGWISLDRRKPSPFNLEAMWLDFPPGAAHRSSTATWFRI